MKLSFEGEPGKVIAEMKEYITRCGLEFGHEEPSPKVIDDHVAQDTIRNLNGKIARLEKELVLRPPLVLTQDSVITGVPKYPETKEELAQSDKGKSSPQEKSDGVVCRFCGRSIGASSKPKLNGSQRKPRIAFHEKYCKSNPDRASHPSDGKRPPWLKGPNGSPTNNSHRIADSWPNVKKATEHETIIPKEKSTREISKTPMRPPKVVPSDQSNLFPRDPIVSEENENPLETPSSECTLPVDMNFKEDKI